MRTEKESGTEMEGGGEEWGEANTGWALRS